MKPEQRVTEYCHLLASIIDATPVSHKCMTALVQARGWMERVAVDLKKEKEANELPQLEVRLHEYPIFLDTLAEHIKNWGIASRRSVASLQQWSITFGALLGHQPSPSVPAHEAFTSLLSSLADLCRALEDNIQTSLYPLFHELKAIMENPKRFLDEMHALELPRARCPLWKLFRRLDTCKVQDHQRYLSLRSRLLSELPVLFKKVDRAIGLAIHKVVQEFLGVVKEKWIHFFNSLTEEGECYGGTEETLRAWQMRWEVAQRQLLFWAQTFLSRSELEALLPANGEVLRCQITSEEVCSILCTVFFTQRYLWKGHPRCAQQAWRALNQAVLIAFVGDWLSLPRLRQTTPTGNPQLDLAWPSYRHSCPSARLPFQNFEFVSQISR